MAAGPAPVIGAGPAAFLRGLPSGEACPLRLHLAEAVLAETADLALGMAAGLEQHRERGFAGLPALVRRTAVEAREAGFGFFGLDRVVRDHLHGFVCIHRGDYTNPAGMNSLRRNC